MEPGAASDLIIDDTLANLPTLSTTTSCEATHRRSSRQLEQEVSAAATTAARGDRAASRPTSPPGTRSAKRDLGPRMTPDLESRLHDLGEFIRDQRRNARLSLRKLSELAGISNPYLSQIERGLRKPRPRSSRRSPRGCASRPRRSTCGPGSSSERDDEHDLVGDILRDRTISERQKQALVDIYRSFQREHDRGRRDRRRPSSG